MASTEITGVSTGIRVSISILVALILGLFILLWDSGIFYNVNIPVWIGPFIIVPLLATILVFAGDCLIQQLSCGEVQWIVQLQRASVVPIPFWFISTLLYFIPSLRWPIEGLIQGATPLTRKGLSSGFYIFWTALYTQSIFISLAQLC